MLGSCQIGAAATETIISEAEDGNEAEATETVTLVGKRRKQQIGQHNVRIQQDEGSPRYRQYHDLVGMRDC